jgi:hypothetical protein
VHSTLRLVPWLTLPALIACGGSGGGGSGGGGGPLPPVNHALSFDGTDDLARFVFPIASSTTFTFEAWINPTTLLPLAQPAGIVHLDSAHLLYLESDQTRLAQSISVPGTNSVVAPVGTLQAGVWQHVAGVFDGADIRIYRNGTLVGTLAHPGTGNGTSEVRLGAWIGFYLGLMDEVRVWNVARSESELQASMGSILTGSETGLLAYWRFEGVSGQALLDSTANANHGTLGVDANVAADDPTPVTDGAPVS